MFSPQSLVNTDMTPELPESIRVKFLRDFDTIQKQTKHWGRCLSVPNRHYLRVFVSLLSEKELKIEFSTESTSSQKFL